MSHYNDNRPPADGHDPDDDADARNVIRLPSLAERQRMQREEAAALRKNTHPKPFINLPPATACMLFVLVAIQAVMSLAVDPPVRFDIEHMFGFIPASFTGGAPFTALTLVTPVTYMLLHSGWMHLVMNGLMLMAFGAGVERWIGARRLLVFCVICGVISAFAHLLLNPHSDQPVIGVSGALSGLFAAVLVMMNDMRSRAGMATTRMLPLVIVWIAITVGSGMIGMPSGENIAWAAHVGGFLGGFVVLKLMRLA